jgi:hypothetical protein
VIRYGPWAAAFLLLLPVACSVTPPVEEKIYSSCRVLGSSDWKAEVELYAASSSPIPYLRRRLIVTGKVTTAAGVQADIAQGPVSQLDQPVQQVLVRTEGRAEAGAPVTQNVRAVMPAMDRYGGVAIRCGDGIIAEIRDVPVPPRDKGEDPFRLKD